MASLNRIEVIGNLTSKPELKTFEWGEVSNISIATNYTYKKKDGEVVEEVEFFDATLNGGAAKFAAQYADKGRQVRVVGRLVTQKWVDADGNEKTKKFIKADIRDGFMIMGNKGESSSKGDSEEYQSRTPVSIDELELEL